jgi:GTPase
MAFVDELTVHIKAGKGGDGVVRFRHEKHKEFGGPSGGDGGRGGDIYIEASRDLSLLFKYRHDKEFNAKDGEDGGGNDRTGKGGEDLTILLPIGSIVTNKISGKTTELLRDGERVRILRGGDGGLGNDHFKSATNQTPKQFTKGKQGEESDFDIELRLVVDVGFAGFPNAGKSSLLNVLTNASAKVGAYQFTTLEPNLGAFFGYVLADIPGLIEGASSGKGLGHKFLRHITRTKMIAHLVSLENEDALKAYATIRKELEAFEGELSDKEEIIILTKTDLVDEATLEKVQKTFAKFKRPVFSISVYDDKSLKNLADELVKLLRKKEIPA